MSFLTTSKRLFVQGAWALGAPGVVSRSSWRRKRLLILCYHGVSQADEHECSGLYVSPAHLRRRFSRLQKMGAAVLPLAEGLRRLREGSLPRTAVSLTFDDGFADFHGQAYPLLKEFGFPATVYVATYYCKLRTPVFDPLVAYILWKARGRSADLTDWSAEFPGKIPYDPAQRELLHGRILSRANELGLSASGKNDLARTLASRCGVDFDRIQTQRLYHLMNPAELASLDPSLVDVQLHTHRHRPPLERNLLKDEISDNRAALSSYLGRSNGYSHFCYPSGIYARQVLPWLEANGIDSATTCDPGLAERGTHPLLLPRFIDTEDVSEAMFDGWVSGFSSWLPQRPGNDRDRTLFLQDVPA